MALSHRKDGEPVGQGKRRCNLCGEVCPDDEAPGPDRTRQGIVRSRNPLSQPGHHMSDDPNSIAIRVHRPSDSYPDGVVREGLVRRRERCLFSLGPQWHRVPRLPAGATDVLSSRQRQRAKVAVRWCDGRHVADHHAPSIGRCGMGELAGVRR